ncbi:non-ribosomal peptide synthetase, partial [Chamaesiphon polymorphus]
MSDLLQQLAKLSPEKQQLLLRRLKSKQSGSQLQPIPQLESQADYPLSFAQQRLWFLQQLDPHSTNYHIPGGLRLHGELDVAALQQSLQAIVDRHGSLRANFGATAEGEARQSIGISAPPMLQPIDLRDVAADDRSTAVQRLTAAINDTPFDLTTDPLLRMQLVQVDTNEYLLLFCMHHIVSDGWSMGILTQELAALYTAAIEQQPPALPELTIQYTDFAHWQRQLLTGEFRERQMQYWQQQLSGLPPQLELPTDRPRPTVQTFAGEQVVFFGDRSLDESLTKLSQEAGTTLFMTLLAAFQLLLYRYTNQTDIAVGSPIANRNRPEIENLIGFFVNTLVMRTDLSGQPTFRELLRRVQSVALGAYEHQDMPFELVVEAVQPERDLSYSPLFQVMFVLQNAPAEELQLPNLSLSPIHSVNNTAKFDLTLSIDRGETGFSCAWEYNTDLFDRATIDRMNEHFHRLLVAIVDNPDCAIEQLQFMPPAELDRLAQLSQSDLPQSGNELCLHTLFDRQVSLNPERIAVVCGTESLSYADLNHRANRLAHYLQSLGVGAETLVGIYMERSIDLIVSTLAIIKAGGAYVPLDPTTPVARLSLMLDDTQLPILLTQADLLGQLPPTTATTICVDRQQQLWASGSDSNPTPAITPTNLAYIIYTSGSTGIPKGVMIPHQGITRLVLDTNYVSLNASDRIAQAANTAFDAATFEIWGALLNGAQLVVIPRSVLLAPTELATMLKEQEITTLFLTPALFNQVASLVPTAFSHLRYLIMGGEALDPHWVRVVQAAGAPEHLLNGYGPTESTTFATYYEVAQLDPAATNIPIGRPLAQTQVYILDPYLHQVPVGIAGELHIGGNGLARGYWQRPELTAEKFIPHPWGESGDRLYKTGDLVRYLPSGEIEYLGRIDQQVKVRGFRIELGEIEAVLTQHPDLLQASVQAHSNQSGQKQLVAYVAAPAGIEPSSSQLRQFLATRLPDYMVPAVFIVLSELPLTPNGKVDKRALPEPDWNSIVTASYVAPQTEVERQLAQIWAEVLGLSQVGMTDNFFAIGGDSILSLQIVARSNQAGIKISPKQLFAHQSIGELARVAGTGVTIVATQGLVTGAVPLSPIQQWFFEEDLPDPHHFNQAVLLKVPADLSSDLFQQVLEAIVSHHDALRLQFTRDRDGTWQQTNAALETLPQLQIVDLSELTGVAQIDKLTEVCSQQQASLDLAAGCLLRAALVRMGAGQPQRLLLAIHHLAVDGVSWRILLADLQTAYHQLSQGEAIALPAKTTAWQQWVQKLATATADFYPELAYWQAIGDRQFEPLPQDYPGDNTVAATATVSVSLSATATQNLLQRVPTVYRTQINDLLLAALAQTIGAWTKESAVRLDLEGHGREELFEDVDISRTVGWFTTLFPLCLELPSTDRPDLLIKTIKEQLRAIPHKGLGYGVLRYLERSPSLQAQAAAAIGFNYLGQFDRAIEVESDFQLAQESAGADLSPQGHRQHSIEIGALIANDRLQFNWSYSQDRYDRQTIEQLADNLIDRLAALIDHCLEPTAGGYTPSDFPLARLSQGDLDRLIGDRWQQVADLYPLSPMQQGLLFHSLYAPETGVYMVQVQCTLQGHLNCEIFSRAWQQVVDRYEIFRTGFIGAELATPLQCVFDRVPLVVDRHDWQQRDWETQQVELDRLVQQQRQQSFDLAQPPLMRLQLVQLNVDTYELIWTHHHLLLDGWSLPLVLKEVFAAYHTYELGQIPTIVPTTPYRSYIAWLQAQDLTAAKQFWQAQLEGITAPTPLFEPIDRSALGEGYQLARLQLSVDETTAIQQFIRQHQLTANNLVQGAWALLLSRYSGNADVVFGATVSGRPATLPGVEEIVGLFINTLPVRVSLPTDTTLLPWLRALQQQQQEIDRYAYTPLAEVQGWSEVPRGVQLFDSIVVFENYPVGDAVQGQPEASELQISNVRCLEQTNYPLNLIAIPGDALILDINYDRSRFTAATIDRMLGHLQHLLLTMLQAGDCPLQDLDPIDARERQQLLALAIAPTIAYPLEQSFDRLFVQQVQQQPQAIALICDDRQLTYAALEEQVERLAGHLYQSGVRAHTVVGLCVNRSIEMAIGLLAIWRSGGVYLPLDPEYPLARLQFMVNDAGVSVLVGHRDCLTAELTSDLPCLYLEELLTTPLAVEVALPQIATTDPAYLLYTSGSTGQPKGVSVDRQTLLAHCCGMAEYYQLQPHDRVLQFASLNFDPSLEQLLPALIAGAGVVLRGGSVWSAAELLAQLQDHSVTVANLPTAYWRQVTTAWQHLGVSLPSQLRLTIVGGEALLVSDLAPWQSLQHPAAPAPTLINAYGPTEATITALTFVVPDDFAGDRLPIGRPLPNRRAYILDPIGRICPTGVPGELHLGGAGLARGYYRQSALTAEKFVSDPFQDGSPARMYRTGDLARYLPNGDIEYLGRLDRQVKIRGFRVELAEIATVLSRHPAIQDTTVQVYTPASGQQRLVVYYASYPTAISVSEAELQQFLATSLPEYMVPSLFVRLDRLPLTPSGKIDRQALPDPLLMSEATAAIVLPTTPTEIALAEIWQEVLGLPQVSANDNFFAIGGDSILSLQIIARANQAGMKLTLKELFAHPSIGDLATVVSFGAAVPAEQGIVTGAVPLTPIQAWFFAQPLPDRHHYNQTLLLVVPADLSATLLQQVLTEIVRHHDALRLQFIATDRGWEQQHAPLSDLPQLQIVDLSELTGVAQTDRLTEICSQHQASLDLAAGCLLHATLFEMGAGQPQRLLLAIHHLAVDGVSWRILLADLQTAYQQLSQGEAIALPAKTTSWQQWAQQLTAGASDFMAELDYWQAQAQQQSTLLPSDRTGENSVSSTETVSMSLSAEMTQDLLQRVPAIYRTQIDDLLLAALTQTIGAWAGTATVQIDLEGHGREELFTDVNISRTVGWFTTMFPIYLTLPANHRPASILKSIKEQLRQVPHKGIGYGLLRYICQELREIERDAAPISFNYLGQFDRTLEDESDFQLAEESAGAERSDRGERQHDLDVSGLIAGGRLQMSWSYSHNRYDRQTIVELAQSYMDNLTAFIAHCLEPNAGGYTPSDFPLVNLTQTELDLVVGDKWRQVADIYPLSPMQQGMLFHTLYAPDGGMYVELVQCTLQGNLDRTIFAQAWQQAIDRYDIFRTGFLWAELSTPLQVVYDRATVPFVFADWQGQDPQHQQQQLAALIDREHRGFDLHQPPLMRLHLIQLSADTYEFIWSSHHLLLDGWSLPLVFEEVFASYHACEQGQPIQPISAPSYRSYIAWIQAQDMAAAKVFWQQQLQGIAAPTPLIAPVDRSTLTSGMAAAKQHLSADTTTLLQTFVRQHRLTLSNLIQGTWALLLSRYSGTPDVVFGVTVSGRPATLPNVEKIVGLFINTLPMRATIPSETAADETIASWLQTLQTQQQEIDRYAYTALVEIQGWSDVPRGVALFDSIVVFENYPIGANDREQPDSNDLQITNVRSIEQTNYPLTLTAIPGAELALEISYNCERFSPDTIERMLTHFQQLLLAMVADIHCPLAQLPLLSPAEQQQLLAHAIAPTIDYPVAASISTLISQQAARTPQAIALICDERQLSYADLERQVQTLAWQLSHLGVKPHAVVGLCANRSIELVIGLLAILQAGGVYLPLDPQNPLERLQSLCTDAGAIALVGHRDCLMPELVVDLPCLYLDEPLDPHTAIVALDSLPQTAPTDPAYLLYTSGSTGKPKGVLVDHQALVAHCLGIRDRYQLVASDRVLLFAAFTFDPALEQLLPALITGCQTIVRGDRLWSAVELWNQIDRHGITIADLPTAYWRQLVPAWLQSDRALPAQLRLTIVGGEALLPADLPAWQALQTASDRSLPLINAYGPTETTITALTYTVPANFEGERLPIGSPLPNRRAYILDPSGQLCPIGVLGELCLGGASLAVGYYRQPTLTSAQFVPDPFDPEPGARMYRTGDLARYLPDGQIEYWGRIDRQVKIRGFRVELAEIESLLSEHPALQAVVLDTYYPTPGQQRLVAYYVCRSTDLVTTAELQQFLAAKLPAYMVPSAFMAIDRLPLTPSGKIDRQALPIPSALPDERREFVAPTTPTEIALAQIWAAVLGLPQVGIHDNFFAIGGDSILSLQIIARANQAGINLTFKQLFAHPSIGELAQVAGMGQMVRAEQGLVIGAVPLTPIQQWFFAQEFLAPHHYNQAVLLTVPADLATDLLQQALIHIVSHHDALRLQFTTDDRGWHQYNAPLSDLPQLQIVDLSDFSEEDRAAQLTELCSQQQASLDLGSGCLLQATLFQMGADRPQRLAIVAHHLVVDGVSWRILLDDIQTAYQQLSQNTAISLPAKTTSWQQWAQQLTAAADDFIDELAYWQTQAQTDESLPTDYPGENTAISTETVSVGLTLEATQDLLRRVPAAYQTQINDVLLAALAQTIAEWTEQSKIHFDLEGHGREELFTDVDISRTVGWFTTMFPVCLHLPDFREPGLLLKTVKEQLRSIPQKGIGYGLLHYVRQELQLGDRAAAQISFNYLGQFDRVLDGESEFQLASESVGWTQDSREQRQHLLDINALVSSGQLQVDWSYSHNLFDRQTIERLAQGFVRNLQALIDHCLEPAAGGYTPSDFPLTTLSQVELDRLVGDNWRQIADIYPLSPMQQGMLFHTVYAPESGMYVELVNCTLQGDLNPTIFQQAWQQAIDRYDIFRTGFSWGDLPEPLQILYREVDLPFARQDWQQDTRSQQLQKLSALIDRERQQGFALDAPPLMRLHLIQLTADTYEFVWSSHHLLLDGWSLPLVFKEVFKAYHAYEQGLAGQLTPATPYRNYIAWLQSQNVEAAITYWQQQLQGIVSPTPLIAPIDRSTLVDGHSTFKLQLPQGTTKILQEFARQHQLTLSNLVQGAWALLLSRYSGDRDVVFGVTVSGRPPTLLGVEEMVGLFINTIPCRVSIADRQEVLPWLQAIQAQQVASEQYAYTPLVKIQAASNLPQNAPLFESIVVFENYPVSTTASGNGDGVEIVAIESLEQTNYPLTLVAVLESELLLKMSYDTSRFSVHTVERMLEHCQQLLSGIVTQPEIPIAQLPLLTPAELHQRDNWQQPQTYPSTECLHQHFERIAATTPERIAISCGEDRWTYAQLNDRANQLAHHLRSIGVTTETLVGLCVERSLHTILGILAIIKAGGAYVPLDPDYPTERLTFIVEDAHLNIILTAASSRERCPQPHEQLICLDRDWETISSQPTTNPPSQTTPEHLAYIIYTSGSTGVPKGVLITHHNVLRLFASTQDYYQFTNSDVWTMFHSYAFDFSVWEIWGALLYGGRLVIVPFWISRSPEDFAHLLRQEGVTVLNQTPSAFVRLIQSPALSDETTSPPALRWVIFGGEALDLASLQPWFERTTSDSIPQSAQLVNMYGITETTVHVTYRLITQADVNAGRGSIIGRPIGDLRLYILDAGLQHLPIGVAGEIYVGGDGLARGYLHRDELTAERFIADPFIPGAQLYKTGDLAKYLPTGELEYLGRSDHQVKIRGFRIELGEIETILSQHPDLVQTVVLAISNASGQQQLVAYCVTAPDIERQPSTTELRTFLGSQLPDYMIPAAFVMMAQFPLTTNGKLDRKALPAPDLSAELATSYVAPQTELERQLAAIWADVLGLERVGREDNFFAIGGDSILSLQIIARANQAGIQLTPKQLFTYQSISTLAQVAGTGTAITAEQGIVTGNVPLTPIQQWFLAQELPHPEHFNLSMLLMVPQELDAGYLQQVLTALVSHHDALRLAVTPSQEQGWQQYQAGMGELPQLSVVDLGQLSVQEQTERLTELCSQQQASLDLGVGCLLSATLFGMGEGQPQRLLLVVHHLAVDAVSWRILLDDLQLAYEQVSSGTPIRLPAKTTSWRQWSQQLAGADFGGELAYWQGQAAQQGASLPQDLHGENTVGSMATVSVSLDATVTEELLRRVPAAYRTQINDLLLAAVAQTIGNWTGEQRVVVDLEGHGREELFEDVDISRTVGWFTTLFPVCLQLPDEDCPRTLIQTVKEQLRQIPQKGIGYGILRYLAADELLSSHHPAPIVFNYLGQIDRSFNVEGEFQLADESAGATQNLEGQRHHTIDINATIVDGQLQVDWSYSTNLHQHSTIESLAQQYLANLTSLVEHCLEPNAGGYTPSDFPLARLTQSTLDRIVGEDWREVIDIYPLSPMQQGMLFHSLYAPDSGVYMEVFHCTLQGHLDLPTFCQAWQRVIDRYDVFRTGFIWTDVAEPLQYVRKHVSLPFTYYDWQELDPQQQQHQISDLLASEQQGFDLTQPPLMRLTLVRLTPDRYELIWTHHHLLLDGWSLPLVFKEVFADVTDTVVPTTPYRNYIAWLQAQDLASAKSFWQAQLQGITAPTPLLALPMQSAADGYQTLERRLAPAHTAIVQEFARQHHLTINNLIQGVWALLLSRYSGERDVVFGVTVSGRPPALPGVEEIVGLFINTLPMRVTVADDLAVVPWLQTLQAQQQEIDRYSYTPLIEIQGWSDVPRSE